MKKLLFLALFAICITIEANADVYIIGKIVKVEQGQGNTWITCKGNRKKCVEIATNISPIDGSTVYFLTGNFNGIVLVAEGKELEYATATIDEGKEKVYVTVITIKN